MQPPRTYHSPRRSAATLQTRERLLASAAELLREPEGAQHFTLESVAKAAGVTRLTVYNLFGSRRALLEAVFDDRALSGGLQRIAGAMAESDPHVALRRLISIFVDFWASDRAALRNLHGLGGSDPEYAESLRARNQRRRQAIAVLVGRLAESNEIRSDAREQLTDELFALTSFTYFADLTANERGAESAGKSVAQAAEDAVRRASPRAK
jgi:AcrR family transcriptional regulator